MSTFCIHLPDRQHVGGGGVRHDGRVLVESVAGHARADAEALARGAGGGEVEIVEAQVGALEDGGVSAA